MAEIAFRSTTGTIATMTRARRYVCAELVGALAIMLVATPVHAQQADPFPYTLKMTPEEGPLDPAIQGRYTGQWKACQKNASITRQNAACYKAEFARQDAVLNRSWQAALGRLRPGAHQPLLRAQRTWIAARDPFCKAVADSFDGGSITPIAYLDCEVEQTIRRAIWLDKLH